MVVLSYTKSIVAISVCIHICVVTCIYSAMAFKDMKLSQIIATLCSCHRH